MYFSGNFLELLRKFLPYYLIPAFLVCFLYSHAQRVAIAGTVTDAKTGEPLSSSSVYLLHKVRDGVITDTSGHYKLNTYSEFDTIVVSRIGYADIMEPVKNRIKDTINFQLKTSSSEMAGVVVAARSKYTRAQLLVRHVIKNKQKNDVYEDNTFQCRIYDKVELDIKNIPEKLQHSFLMKPLAFAFQQMDTTDGKKKFLPVYLSESIADWDLEKNPSRERYNYEAVKTSGNSNETILAYVDGLYKGLNLYHNNINILKTNFISPVADDALSFYSYHISDTVYFNNHRCIKVLFSPKEYATNTFTGYMWIADTVYAIKSIMLYMDKSVNIDLVQQFEVNQNFELDSSGRYLPARNEIDIDFKLPVVRKFGMIAKKTTLYQNVILNNKDIDTVFSKKQTDLADVISNEPDNTYWDTSRFEPLNKSEKFVYTLVDTVKKIPLVVFYNHAITALTTGYYRVGKFDIGHIYSFYRNDVVEGPRYSFGLRTNKFLTPKFQAQGFGGYSTKDKMIRYDLSTLFVLNQNAWSTLFLSYSNDLESSIQYNDELDQNSLLGSSLIRVNDSTIRLVNNREAFIGYNKYFDDGFGFGINARSSEQTPYFNIYYTDNGRLPFIVGKSGPQDDYKTNEISATVRYAIQEKFVARNFLRISLGSKYPIFHFTYTKGFKVNNGFLASDFNYSKFNVGAYQDFADGRLGRLTYSLQAGITQGTLPILLLDVQKGNDTYYYNPHAFNNMNQYEFVADRYVKLLLQQTWGSFPFKYISFMHKLKWRSLTTFNAVLGNMSEANKVANGYYDNKIDYHFYVPNKTPYMEAGVGIANIFDLLRFDAIWRLTYRNNPDVPKFGVLASLELKF